MFHRKFYTAYISALLILFACLLPSSAMPQGGPKIVGFDKFVHFVMYLVLTWTLVYGFLFQTKYPHLKDGFLKYSFSISFIYGGVIEVLQLLITYDRSAEWLDLLADSLGVIVALLTYKFGNRLLHLWHILLVKALRVFGINR